MLRPSLGAMTLQPRPARDATELLSLASGVGSKHCALTRCVFLAGAPV